jgi:hypothetical protein
MRRAHDLYFHRDVRFDNKLTPAILREERRVLLQRLNWGAVAAATWFEILAVASVHPPRRASVAAAPRRNKLFSFFVS